MALGDIVRLSMVAEQDFSAIGNTWHYIDRVSGVTPDLAAMIGQWRTSYQGAWMAGLGVDFTQTFMRAQVVAGPNSGMLQYSYETVNGADTGPMQAPELCVSIKRSTGYAGRHQRGRNFYGPVPASLMTSQEDGKVNVGDSRFSALISVVIGQVIVGGITWRPCLVNKTLTPTAHDIITAEVAIGLVHRKTRRSHGLAI